MVQSSPEEFSDKSQTLRLKVPAFQNKPPLPLALSCFFGARGVSRVLFTWCSRGVHVVFTWCSR
eukprot:13415635-Alexandrium_andersonii.AAC.1